MGRPDAFGIGGSNRWHLVDDPEAYICPRHGAYQPDNTLCDYERWTCPPCRREGHEVCRKWRAAWDVYDRWRSANVPLRFRNRRFENFRAHSPQAQQALAAAKSLVAQHIKAAAYIGGFGSGKTHLGAAVLAAAVRGGHTGLWISVPDLLLGLRACFQPGASETEHQILMQLGASRFLVLDEIGAKAALTEYEANIVWMIIDRRYRQGQAMVLTGNTERLSDAIGKRSADRIGEMGVTIALTGESYRERAIEDAALEVPDDFSRPPDRIGWIANEKGVDRRQIRER